MPQTTKTFRVFVSSTFTDMREERRILQRDVFPRLKALCESRGASFQDVDLRWGVNEEAQLDQKIMDICLGEIARCQKLSPRPNFIILLGDKYGWQPVPSRILSSEMVQIRCDLASDNLDMVDRWYREDLNADPPEYVLQPRGDEYREYGDWRKIEDRLKVLLRSAVEELSLSEEQKAKYFVSATHQEIMAGALNPPPGVINPEDHVFAYMRKIHGFPEDTTAADYIDLDGEKRDARCKAQLDTLKKKLKAKLPKKHIYNYGATWDDGCKLDKAKSFANRVYKDLKSVIERELAEIADVDPITREKRLHEEFREQRREHFTGRKEALKEIAGYLESPSQQVFTILGSSGSGKTSLLAKALHEARERNGALIFRFLGTTSTTSDPFRLLTDLIAETTSFYQVDTNSLLKDGEDEKKFSTLRGLQELFIRCLELADFERPLLVVLDALDQLSGDVASLTLEWLPVELPEHVKLIVSALPELREKLSRTIIYDLTAMSSQEGEELLTTWLSSIDRTLTPQQIQLVINRFSTVGAPLFLKLAFEKARKWHSYDTDVSLKKNVAGVLDEFFEGLEMIHGHQLLKTVCCYLLCGKYQGLMERELLDLLVVDEEYWSHFLDKCHPDHRQEVAELKRLPIVVWSRLFLELESYLTTRNAEGLPVISFYHRMFIDYAKNRYLKDTLPWHCRIADYFAATPLYLDQKEDRPNVRKVVEQPWQQTLAHQWEAVADQSMANFPFLMAKAKANMVERILEDYELLWSVAPENIKVQLDLWRAFFAERAHILRRGNEEWSAYKILLQLAVEHADDSPLTIGAEEWLSYGRCDWLWLRRMQRMSYVQKNPCLAVLEGHTDQVEGALELSDQQLLSWSQDKTLRLWDSMSGFCLKIMEGHTDQVKGALELSDHRLLSWSQDKTLRLWDSKNGSCLKILEGHTDQVEGALELSDQRLLSWSRDNSLRLWESQNGLCLKILEGHTNRVDSAVLLNDGRVLSGSWDHTLRLWDAQSGACLTVLEGHIGSIVVGALALSDGRVLSWTLDLTFSGKTSLQLWNVESGTCLKVLKGHNNIIIGAMELSDGRLLSWSGDSTLRLWDSHCGACLMVLRGHSAIVFGAVELKDGRLLSWSEDQTLRLWDAQSGTCLNTMEGHGHWVKGAVALSDGRLLSWSGDTTLRLWDGLSMPRHIVLEGHASWVRGAVAFSKRRLLSWSHDKTMRLWDGQSGECLKVFEGHSDEIEGAMEFSDGHLLSWSWDKTIRLWDVQSGTCLKVLEGHSGSSIAEPVVLSNGQLLSWSEERWGSGEKTLWLWDVCSGACLKVLEGHSDIVVGAIELSDQCFLSWSCDKTLRSWDSQSGVCRHIFEGHSALVEGALELSDQRLLSWSQDKTLRLWDSKSGSCLKILEGHTDQVKGALELSDQRLLSWSHDKTLRLWDSKSGSCLKILEGHNELIAGALELSDQHLLSWSVDRTFRLWDSKSGACLEVENAEFANRHHSAWVYALAQVVRLATIAGNFFIAPREELFVSYRDMYLCHKRFSTLRVFWEAESRATVSCLFPDGTAVVTQENGQVCFLKLLNGNCHISLAEAEELLQNKGNIPQQKWVT